MTTRAAGKHEAGEIARVINLAFNPAESFFVEGDRIDPDQVRQYFEKGAFLVAVESLAAGDMAPDMAEEMAGCIYVELRGDGAYFGLLGVDPARQKGGIGSVLISCAESYARRHGCRYMDIRIVNLRVELPAFYRKLGYREAGTEEFTPGAPTKLPCHFIKMRKVLD